MSSVTERSTTTSLDLGNAMGKLQHWHYERKQLKNPESFILLFVKHDGGLFFNKKIIFT